MISNLKVIEVTLGRSIKFKDLQKIIKLDFLFLDFRDKINIRSFKKKVFLGHNSISLKIHAINRNDVDLYEAIKNHQADIDSFAEDIKPYRQLLIQNSLYTEQRIITYVNDSNNLNSSAT